MNQHSFMNTRILVQMVRAGAKVITAKLKPYVPSRAQPLLVVIPITVWLFSSIVLESSMLDPSELENLLCENFAEDPFVQCSLSRIDKLLS